MGYVGREESVDQGNPVEFVRFAIGLDRVYRYTSARSVQVHAAESYTPVYLERDQPSMSPEIQENKLTLKLPRSVEIAELFKVNAPIQTVWVVYYRRHEDDGETISYWQGRVSGVRWAGDDAQISCDTIETMLKRAGLRPAYSPTCRFFLADGRCPVAELDITINATISSVSGDQLVSADFATKPDHWFQFGVITTPNNDARMVLEHIGDTVTLIAPFEVSPDGLIVAAMAGCDYLPQTCLDKFGTWTDNGRAHGAYNLVPLVNLFEKGLR